MNHPWNTRFFRSLSRCSRWGMGFAMTFHLYPPLFYAVFLKVATCSNIMRQHITKSMGTGNVVRIFPSELLNDILEATKQNDIPDHLWHVYIYRSLFDIVLQPWHIHVILNRPACNSRSTSFRSKALRVTMKMIVSRQVYLLVPELGAKGL